MDFALRCAYAHGTAPSAPTSIPPPPQHEISWPVFAEMRDRWAGRIELQAVSLVGVDHVLDEAYARRTRRPASRQHGGMLGGRLRRSARHSTRRIEAVVMVARPANAASTSTSMSTRPSDPEAAALRILADAVARDRLRGQGRSPAIAARSPRQHDATRRTRRIDRVAEAGIAVVSLPMCNMYLQDRVTTRPAPCARRAGAASPCCTSSGRRGVPVAVASDNTRDPFYAYGDLDMVEVFREAVRIAHFDHPFGAWAGAPSPAAPAAIVGRAGPRHRRGRRARRPRALPRPHLDRTARPPAGRPHGAARRQAPSTARLPDYRELDDLMVSA